MVVAIYRPADRAEPFKADRLQSSLHRIRKLAQKFNRTGGQVEGEVLLCTDVKLMQTLEASFCLAREVASKHGMLIDPIDNTRGGSRLCAEPS